MTKCLLQVCVGLSRVVNWLVCIQNWNWKSESGLEIPG